MSSKTDCGCGSECAALRSKVERLTKALASTRKELLLPEGTQVLSPGGVYAVIGKRGLIDPESVRLAKAAGPGQPSGDAGKFRFTSNDPRQLREPGALPNSSAPLPGGQRSFSRRPDPGRLFGPVTDRSKE